MTDPSPSPERAAASIELGRLMETAIDALPVAYRTVFMLRSVQELTVAETARCLDLTEGTVKSRLFRAKKLLQERLATQVERATPAVHAFDGERCDRLTQGVMARIGVNS